MNPYARHITETLIRRGLAVRPTYKDKIPGKGDAGWHAEHRLTLNDLDRYEQERFNVIVGSKKSPNLCGILDVETDGPEGEENLRRHVGELPDGPQMVTPSGSIHRLMMWMPEPDGHRTKINIKGLFGKGTKVDVPWQFLAVDGERRYWKGLNLRFPIPPQQLLDVLWTPEQTTKVYGRANQRGINDEARPPAPAWVPERMRLALAEPAPTSGRHTRIHHLVGVGWVHARMSSDAILAVVAADPTCWDWASDGRATIAAAMDRLRDDVTGRLDYFHWSKVEDRWRKFIDAGRTKGELTVEEALTLVNRRGLVEAKSRAAESGLLCGKAHRREGRAGRPAKLLVFFDPATKVCPYGHRKGFCS